MDNNNYNNKNYTKGVAMKINFLGTGSKGNCAILNNGKSKIMIDCGLKFEDITLNESFGSFSNFECLLITHEHRDHSLSQNKFNNCITVMDTNKEQGKIYDFDFWRIMPFEVKHDVKCFGYLIKDKTTNKNILWATDFSNMPIIKNTHIDIACIECNYDNETIFDKNLNNEIINSHFENHNSLENLVSYLEKLENKPNTLVMLHKSNDNLNTQLALDKTKNLANNIFIAHKNLEVIL